MRSAREIGPVLGLLLLALPAGPAGAAGDPARGAQLFVQMGCTFCHADGGRAQGKCPQLMNTKRDDDFISNRIATGKKGRMPSSGAALSLDDIDSIIAYIRTLHDAP